MPEDLPKLSSRERRELSFSRQKRALTQSDPDGRLMVDECRICHAVNVVAHSKYPTMCATCGRLYARVYSRNVKDRITAGEALLGRCDMSRMSAETETTINKVKQRIQEARVVMENAKETHKKCKQCGRDLPISCYREYARRGSGLRNTDVGHHTVCRDCENMNQLINYSFNKPEDKRNARDIELLKKAKALYLKLAECGLEPKGKYAAYVLGTLNQGNHRFSGNRMTIDDYMDKLLGGKGQVSTAGNASDANKTAEENKAEKTSVDNGQVPQGPSGDPLLDRGRELLNMELTEEPDVYQNMVDEWREQISGPDMRVKEEYRDLFNAVATRIDDYEDNYKWDE